MYKLLIINHLKKLWKVSRTFVLSLQTMRWRRWNRIGFWTYCLKNMIFFIRKNRKFLLSATQAFSLARFTLARSFIFRVAPSGICFSRPLCSYYHKLTGPILLSPLALYIFHHIYLRAWLLTKNSTLQIESGWYICIYI